MENKTYVNDQSSDNFQLNMPNVSPFYALVWHFIRLIAVNSPVQTLMSDLHPVNSSCSCARYGLEAGPNTHIMVTYCPRAAVYSNTFL